MVHSSQPDLDANPNDVYPVGLSFDIEEHHRIETAAHLQITPALRETYAHRMEDTTAWLLDQLGQRKIRATFFVVGQIARSHPRLVRRMADEGHEVGSHSWAHQRVHRFTPHRFKEDLLQSMDALAQVSGQPVVGFRAPTFSVVKQTAWAIDVLAEVGLMYDSSIFPVRHDRYGVPEAPRSAFIVQGATRELLELPPLTLRAFGQNLPVAGGGYFRLFPLALMKRGIRQAARRSHSPAVLYFHPWEFDPEQPALPLSRLARFRTYVGINRTRRRLAHLLDQYHFAPLKDLAQEVNRKQHQLPRFKMPTPDGGSHTENDAHPAPSDLENH
jgi:polysaccharide deacetylase family protein (PEP-CTERM system associated)